jgi:general secretion pathway protein N
MKPSAGLALAVALALWGDAHAIVAIPPIVAQPGGSEQTEPDIAPPQPAMPQRATPRPPARAEPADSGNPLWGVPLNQLSDTRERPIFSPSRRPPPRPVAGTPRAELTRAIPKPVEHERPALLLVGTVIGDEESIGVFVDNTTKEAVRLRAGQAHNGWMLRIVNRREVTLEKNEETATLALPQPSEEKAAPSPPSAAPARNRRR